MSNATLIRHSSPTLAGIKTGSLFLCRIHDARELTAGLRAWNRILHKKGIRAICLKQYDQKALIYVYRISRLQEDLRNELASSILRSHGYDPLRLGACLTRLIHRLRRCDSFPHEIGLFLGYPPKDVLGFIKDGAGACKCYGWWKVYDDVETAQRQFRLLDHCKETYGKLYDRGFSFERLIVAG